MDGCEGPGPVHPYVLFHQALCAMNEVREVDALLHMNLVFANQRDTTMNIFCVYGSC